MAAGLPIANPCCEGTTCGPDALVPGPTGPAGADGADGTIGVNAFTTTTAQFTMPASQATVSVEVGTTAWMAVGQVVLVQTAGHFEVDSITDADTVVLKNLGYAENAAELTIIASDQRVAAAGFKGLAGLGSPTGAAGGDLAGTYPNPTLAAPTVKGDIIVRTDTSNVRQGVGLDGLVLTADSVQTTGVKWAKVDAATSVINILPIVNGGTGGDTAQASFDSISPLTDRGDLIIATGTAASGSALPIGAADTVLKSDGLEPVWGKVTKDNLDPSVVISGTWAKVFDEVVTNTSGGSLVGGQWNERVLQSVDDPSGILAGFTDATPPPNEVPTPNRIRIKSTGVYRLRARAPGFKLDGHRIRIKRWDADGTTDLGVVIIGPNAFADATNGGHNDAVAEARITLEADDHLSVEHYVVTTNATDGGGRPLNVTAVTEKYTELFILQE